MVYFGLYLVAAMLPYVHVDGNTKCHESAKVATLEKHCVKQDPTLFIDGTFSEVYVRKFHEGTDKCSYMKYTVQSDGSILEQPFFITFKDQEEDDIDEILKKTNKVGVYEAKGNVDMDGEYSGILYMIYADGHCLAYFICEINGAGWNASIQVKSTFKDKVLATAADNEVKQSLAAAKAAMDQLAAEYGSFEDGGLIQYKLEDLCP